MRDQQHYGSSYYPGGPHEPRLDEATVRRLRNLARIGLVWAVLIVGRLFHLQVINYQEFKRLAQSQQEAVEEIRAPRGTIFDRGESALAVTNTLKSVAVNPQLVRDVTVTAEVLARVLQVDAADLETRIKKATEAGRGFLWVKRKISFEESERVQKLQLAGVEFREETVRVYTKEGLAAHVLGGVDHEGRGNAGIEMGLNEELEGLPGTMRTLRDVTRHNYESVVENKPHPGKNVWLTIDERVQYVAETALREAAEGCNCKTGSVVALDPRTGDILAMASYPTYNPNIPPKPKEDLSNRLNLAIAAPFEPGSVFKVITLAAALETTRLGPDSPVNCLGGSINLYGRVIKEAKNGFGTIPMRMVLAKSSNVGAIQVGLQVGVKNLHSYVTKFGFGKRTGIVLPAEDPGQVFEPRKWGKTSIGSVAMGHEVTTTTLQLAQAGAIVANHGRLVKPRIVLKRQRPGEPVEEEPVAAPRQVLRPENATRMLEMMQDVVLPGGTGTRAKIEGYNIGGKTGSAQIYDHKLKQYTHKYNASFLGIAPLTDPRVVIVVTLNGSAEYGGAVAAPVFKEIAAAALRVLDIPRDKEMPVMLAQARRPVEEEEVVDLAYAPETPAPFGVADESEAAAALREMDAPRAPNVVGKTMRDVVQQTAANGIQLEARGSGIARTQRPQPGARLQPGERLVVEFRR